MLENLHSDFVFLHHFSHLEESIFSYFEAFFLRYIQNFCVKKITKN